MRLVEDIARPAAMHAELSTAPAVTKKTKSTRYVTLNTFLKHDERKYFRITALDAQPLVMAFLGVLGFVVLFTLPPKHTLQQGPMSYVHDDLLLMISMIFDTLFALLTIRANLAIKEPTKNDVARSQRFRKEGAIDGVREREMNELLRQAHVKEATDGYLSGIRERNHLRRRLLAVCALDIPPEDPN